MYVLILATIVVTLVIIVILISSGTVKPPITQQSENPSLSYDQSSSSCSVDKDPTRTYSLSTQGLSHLLPKTSFQRSGGSSYEQLISENVYEVDIGRYTCTAGNERTSNITNEPKYILSETPPIGLYNMSVKKIEDGYSGVVRGSTWNGCCDNNQAPAFSYPYSIVLDETGIIKDLHRIDLDYTDLSNCTECFQNIYANGIEDPRLFSFKGQDWIIGNCLGSSKQPHPCVNAMCIFKISDPITSFRVLIPPIGVGAMQRQKNWSPFVWEDKLYCEYSIKPHIIFKIDVETGLTEELYRTGDTSVDITADDSLRGGTPPVLIELVGRKLFLGIGHIRSSSTSDYLHFLYTFEAEPPFKVNKITRVFKLDKAEKIQFAAGLSALNDNIYISYGVDDCYNRISVYNLQRILTLLDLE